MPQDNLVLRISYVVYRIAQYASRTTHHEFRGMSFGINVNFAGILEVGDTGNVA